MSQEVRIQVLDELTANQIAAGEVVERPANAVKEMIENSLDAGAKRIRVEIRGGGRKLIKVSDDGSGMNPSELPLAILRHATSKLRKIDDLDTLHSLGFRGEALASIAAVSRIILTSRQAGSPLGQVLEVKGGKEVRNEPCGAEVGTTIEVQELFFNMPAREKFMKADSAEHRAISEMMTRFALARPDVSFLLEVEGKRSLFTQGNLSLVDAAGSIFGAQVGSELLPVNREDHLGSARGLIGKPTLVKSSRSHQFFFINGRWIQSRMLSQAVEQAYQSMMPKNGFAFVILNITLDPAQLDVNIHPQKTDIRFREERDVFRLVRRAVQDALAEGSALPSQESRTTTDTPVNRYEKVDALPFQFREPGVSYGGASKSGNWTPPKQAVWEEFKSGAEEIKKESPIDTLLKADLLSTYENKDDRRSEIVERNENEVQGELISGETRGEIKDPAWEIQPLGQVGDSFIIARTADELILIDQHAAHERILFDQLLKKDILSEGQLILTDLMLTFGEEEIESLLSRSEELRSLGWFFEAGGPGLLRITQSPAFLGEKETEVFLRQFIYQALESPAGDFSDFVRHAVGHVRSCKSAVKAGSSLHIREIYSLLEQLQETENPYTCPHGRPVVIRMTVAELGKMFKRT